MKGRDTASWSWNWRGDTRKGDYGDFDSAYAGLERAFEIALSDRAHRDRTPSLGATASTVLANVDARNEEGRICDASIALIQALGAQQSKTDQVTEIQRHLYDKGIAQAVLARDVDLAASMEFGKVKLGLRWYSASRDAFLTWFERGQRQGLRFELEVAITLMEAVLEVPLTQDRHGISLNDLGLALRTLGERDSGSARLKAAATAHIAAMDIWMRLRTPPDWTMTQAYAGNVWQALGDGPRRRNP